MRTDLNAESSGDFAHRREQRQRAVVGRPEALARGEVGKVGVPVPHLGDMRQLFADIPLTSMNTSMTINATAMWLLALYEAVAEEQGAPAGAIRGTGRARWTGPIRRRRE